MKKQMKQRKQMYFKKKITKKKSSIRTIANYLKFQKIKMINKNVFP